MRECNSTNVTCVIRLFMTKVILQSINAYILDIVHFLVICVLRPTVITLVLNSIFAYTVVIVRTPVMCVKKLFFPKSNVKQHDQRVHGKVRLFKCDLIFNIIIWVILIDITYKVIILIGWYRNSMTSIRS